MPDSGYQALRSNPSKRPDFLDSRGDAVERSQDKSQTEGAFNKWPLFWTVTIACTLGVAVWGTLIYNIWGSLL